MSVSDDQLVSALQDQRRNQTLILLGIHERWHLASVRYASQRLRHAQNAENAVSEGYARAAQLLSEGKCSARDVPRLKGWWFAVLKHMCKEQHRQNSRHPPSELADDVVPAAHASPPPRPPDGKVQKQEQRRRLRMALSMMQPEEARLIFEYCLSGETERTAAMTQAERARLCRARKKLHGALGKLRRRLQQLDDCEQALPAGKLGVQGLQDQPREKLILWLIDTGQPPPWPPSKLKEPHWFDLSRWERFRAPLHAIESARLRRQVFDYFFKNE
jgi:DNA-directed RNA polymerase specialized sigma24 family protein